MNLSVSRVSMAFTKKKTTGVKRVACACICVYLAFCASFYVPVLSIAIFAFCSFLILCFDQDDLFCFLLFLFPFGAIFKVDGIPTSLFTVLEFIVVFKFLFQKKGVNCSFAFLMLSFISFCCLVLNNIGGYLEISKVILAYFLLYFFAQKYSGKYFKRYFAFYLLAILSSSLMGLFRGVIPRLTMLTGQAGVAYIGNIENGTVTTSIRFSGLNYDPNYYSVMLLPAIIVLFSSLFSSNRRHFVARAVLFMLVSLLGFLTLSKSFILMYVVIFFFILLSNIRRRPLLVVLIFCAGLVLVLINPFNLSSNLLLRFDNVFGERDLNSLTTGRSEIWKMYLESFGQSTIRLFVGNGIDADYLGGRAAHNLYIEAIYKIGIIGLIIYLACYVYIFIRFGFFRKKSFVSYLPIISIALMYFFLAGLSDYSLPFYLMIAFAFFANPTILRTKERPCELVLAPRSAAHSKNITTNLR